MGLDTWTDDLVEALTNLWATGLSTAQIGLRLGQSKNAVIGKARRLGLPMRRNSQTRAAQEKRITTRRIRIKTNGNIIQLPPRRRDLPKNDPVSLLELREHHCRAVVGERNGAATFCAAQKAKASAWCEYHRHLYTVPSNGRR